MLLPAGQSLDELLATVPVSCTARLLGSTFRRYPRTTDALHLKSLVRAGRDPLATRWLRGAALAVTLGAGLGALVNGLLAGCFGMLGGMLEIAIPLGFGLGAFLGGFTAAMTGTEVPRAELSPLWPCVRNGDTLLQWSTNDRDALAALATHATTRALPTAMVSR